MRDTTETSLSQETMFSYSIDDELYWSTETIIDNTTEDDNHNDTSQREGHSLWSYWTDGNDNPSSHQEPATYNPGYKETFMTTRRPIATSLPIQQPESIYRKPKDQITKKLLLENLRPMIAAENYLVSHNVQKQAPISHDQYPIIRNRKPVSSSGTKIVCNLKGCKCQPKMDTFFITSDNESKQSGRNRFSLASEYHPESSNRLGFTGTQSNIGNHPQENHTYDEEVASMYTEEHQSLSSESDCFGPRGLVNYGDNYSQNFPDRYCQNYCCRDARAKSLRNPSEWSHGFYRMPHEFYTQSSDDDGYLADTEGAKSLWNPSEWSHESYLTQHDLPAQSSDDDGYIADAEGDGGFPLDAGLHISYGGFW